MTNSNMTNNPFSPIVDIKPPTYRNSTPVLTLAGVNLSIWDVIKTGLGTRLNLGLYGGAGWGKSQLLADVRSLVGNNASYVLGRNDLDIKTLFRELDFSQLEQARKTGGRVSQQELSAVTAEIYRPLIVVEELNRAAEIVQNQLFNIFEGFIEIDGKKYALGDGTLQTFRGIDGSNWEQNVLYSVGVWSANLGNGQYTGTVSMDKAMKERSHLILDVDNFKPQADDLDMILLQSGGEVRLKEEEKSRDRTKLFADAFASMKQGSYTPNPQELGKELLLFRYLVLGLDYIPCEAADNSKLKMKDVWPSKAEEDDLGATDEEKIMYRMVLPSSPRGALTIMTLARALRTYVTAKNPSAKPTVLDSVVESMKIVGAYSGMIDNQQRIREDFVGNPYKAASKVAEIVRTKLQGQRDLMNAVLYFKTEGKPLNTATQNACVGEYACFR